jgi:hypothetical protein
MMVVNTGIGAENLMKFDAGSRSRGDRILADVLAGARARCESAWRLEINFGKNRT